MMDTLFSPFVLINRFCPDRKQVIVLIIVASMCLLSYNSSYIASIYFNTGENNGKRYNNNSTGRPGIERQTGQDTREGRYHSKQVDTTNDKENEGEMMKEEEAKTKWCPMTFPSESDRKCMASNCMIWKWDDEYSTMEIDKGIWASGHGESATDGHCGLVK